MPQLKSRRAGSDNFCPGAETIAAASEGRLSGPLQTAVEHHIQVCPVCADLYNRSLAFHRAQGKVPPAEWHQVERNLDHWIDGFLAAQSRKLKGFAKPTKPKKVVGWKGPRRGSVWPWALALAAMLLVALGGVIVEKYRSELRRSEITAEAARASRLPVNTAIRLDPELPIIAPPTSNGAAGAADASGEELVAGNNPPLLRQPAAEQITAISEAPAESQPGGTSTKSPTKSAHQTQAGQAAPAESPTSNTNIDPVSTAQTQTPADQQPPPAVGQTALSTPSSNSAGVATSRETAQSAPPPPGQAPGTGAPSGASAEPSNPAGATVAPQMAQPSPPVQPLAASVPPSAQHPATLAEANRSASLGVASNAPYRAGLGSMRTGALPSRNSSAMNQSRPGGSYRLPAETQITPTLPSATRGFAPIAPPLPGSFRIAGGTRLFIRMKSVSRRDDGFYTFNGKLLEDLNQDGTKLLSRNTEVYGFLTENGDKVSLSVVGFVMSRVRYSLSGPLAAALPEQAGSRALLLDAGQVYETWLRENSTFERTDAGFP